MDDLNGLSWSSNSDAPANKPPPMGSGFMFPNVRSNGTSGRSTPMSAASNRSNSPAKPATSTGDSFANLVSFNSSNNNKNLSLLEQQKRMQEEKAKQEAEKPLNKVALAARPRHRFRKPSRPPAEKEEDILAAFNAAAPVDASTNFPIPHSTSSPRIDATSRQGTPSAGIMMQDNTSGLDALGDDDDPFGLNQLKPKPALAPPATQDDDDDFLGLLGKPVSEIPRQPSPQEQTLPFNNDREQNPSPMPSSDEDRAIAELVDMGFPADKSRQALRTTHSGTDIQGAVSYLLTSAHAEARQKTQGREPSNGPSDNRGDRSQSRNRDGPSWMREGRSHQSREDNRSPGAADKDPAQVASQFGNNLLKTAGSFWKAGSKKFQQAVNEFNTEHDSGQPKWMRDASSPHEEPLPPRPPRRGETGQPQSSVTDEAMLLEGGNSGPPRKPTRPAAPGGNDLRQPSPSQHLQQPNFLQRPSRPSSAEPRSRASRFAAEEQSAQAYVSPARRRRPQPPAPAPESNIDLFDSPAPSQEPKPASPAHAPQRSASVPVRPKAPPRSIPPLSPQALQSTHRHREKAAEAWKRGDFAAAHESYSTALGMLPEKHPITIIIRSNRAMTGLRIGEPKAVIDDAETMLAVIGPSKGEAETIDLGNGDSPKPMKDFFGKALMRKAEALEHLERWADAAQTWKLAVESGHGGSTSIQGRNRCEKAAGISKAPPKPAAPAKKPTPAPKKPSALPDLSGSSGTGQDSEAVSRLREANKAAEREDDEKFALSESVDLRITNWKNGKQDNLRALLGSLDAVLWAESGWKKISLAELVLPNKVKIQYMKGIAKVHPDKIPTTATTEQRMISSAVFGTLNEAWDKFRVENNL
ncbi:Ubiquitin-associated/translation elongation factor EF1B N-terminal eukaryote [Penicillium waksmanii]|uniref:Ubiquitin-associated/translation elongation factor EF1B N-terminal eukaryote n=1 Tax=Penicillium waksmanii TaxID=69791 RepID=UPI0025489074|nr:Ubiquitin-associated/translation elongation factor EF1B N-terminal eukaryote [Penicillium waksmanii]KAJ5995252.1 Ubiquitin-associated/translation elongation factor EF1B N-terminal eukaryote [Penicillium waksmanii]